MKKQKSISTTVIILLFITVAQANESEINRGLLAWSAFQCATFAELSENIEEQERLFKLGFKTSRALLNDIQNEKISPKEKEKIPVGILFVLAGPSVDFVVGRIYSAAVDDAYESVVKKDSNGLIQLDPTKWANGELRKIKAANKFRDSNCGLLGN
jgi:hypothetical protein